LVKGLENTLNKFILSLEFYEASGRQKIATGACALVHATPSAVAHALKIIACLAAMPLFGSAAIGVFKEKAGNETDTNETETDLTATAIISC
jgi:hypothetical protein